MQDLLSSVVNESNYININNQQRLQRGWFVNLSVIKSGNSAILDGNKFSFYGVQCIAIVVLTFSILSSVTVIINIYWTHRSRKKWDFSDRFPLYLAIADTFWGVMKLTTNHIFLLTTKTIPDEWTSSLIGINVAAFLGYQQLMVAGLATYTYLKIVQKISLDLGKYEWKLQAFCVTILAILAGILYPLGTFGSSGYWFLVNPNSISGVVGNFLMTIIGTTCTLCTIMAYKAIRRVVEEQRQLMKKLNALDNCDRSHSTAARCLTTFVYVSLFVNGPMCLVGWALAVQYCFGVLDPITASLVVLTTDSNGWANAWAYFHNKTIKKRRKLFHMQSRTRLVNSSSISTTTSNSVCRY